MARVLIIGAGGVSSVVVHKCAQANDVFTEIHLASRTKAKCDAIAESVKKRYGVTVHTASVDADNVSELVALINKVKTSNGYQCRTAVSRPYHYGRLPRMQCPLP